jgi:hypothetical protein
VEEVIGALEPTTHTMMVAAQDHGLVQEEEAGRKKVSRACCGSRTIMLTVTDIRPAVGYGSDPTQLTRRDVKVNMPEPAKILAQSVGAISCVDVTKRSGREI